MDEEIGILESGATLGPYRIVRHLARGGMGRVYEAEHIALGVRRALKFVSVRASNEDALRSRFLVEGRTLANLDHPRVVRIYDLAVDELTGAMYFAMDFVLSPDGTPRTLEDERLAGVDEDRVAGWFADICDGLDYVHSKGIVHRDIKLENILIGPDGHAVISDFGISGIVDEDLRDRIAVGEPLSEENLAFRMGTAAYLAPELERDDQPAAASAESDAWALGVSLFRLLTGLWFEDDGRAKCMAMLEDYELPWRDVVARLCSANPSRRLASGRLAPLAVGVCRCRTQRRRKLCIAVSCAAASLLVISALAIFVCRKDSDACPAEGSRECLVHVPEHDVPPRDDIERKGASHDSTVHLCQDSPKWSDFHSKICDASYRILLAPFDGMDASVDEVMRQFIERQASFYCYDIYWPRERLEMMDALVAAHMSDTGILRRASTPQLLVLAGEIYRQKRMLEYGLGEFHDDIDRLAALANSFIIDVSDRCYDAEWAFEILEATFPFDRLEGRRIGSDEVDVQRRADPWLAKMLRSATLAAEAARAHDSSMSAADEREHDGKRALAARLCKEALMLQPGRYRAAERLIALARDDDEARSAFERCQKFCFDDLRAWKAYANTLLDLDDPRRERLAIFLDQALETARYDTWAPAFYVIGRWSLIARYDKDGWTLDDRSWAFTDENVRRNVLEVIRRYKDGEIMSEAPKPRRLAVTAMFAASALMCGDDDLAAKLVSRIPANELNAVLGMAMRTTSPTFRKLKNMVKYPPSADE